MYKKKCSPHFHEIKLPSGRLIRSNNDCFRNSEFMYSEELGILPALAALAPAAISIGSKILGGKKGGKAAPSTIDTSSILSAIQSAERGANSSEVRAIVRELLAEVPPPVREQVNDALREYKLQNTDIKETMNKIVNDIGKQVSPTLNQAIALLQEAQLQKEATNEHNIIVKDDKRWDANTTNQKLILERIDILENRIANEIRARKAFTFRTAAAFGMPNKVL